MANAKKENDRPNIILIITDEQRPDTIHGMGNPHMITPNLDKMMEEGVTFSNCFSTGASCAPARASLFSGMFPNNSGVRRNGDRWKYNWVKNLKDAGYYTVNIGKMHIYPYEDLNGFDERFVVENKDRFLEGRYHFDRWDMFLEAKGIKKPSRASYREEHEDYEECLGAFDWKYDKDTHSDVFVGDTVKKWLAKRPKPEQPLFLEIGFPGPHPPFDPPKEYGELYQNREIPMPEIPEGYEETLTPYLKGLIQENIQVDHDSVVWQKHPRQERVRKMRENYYGNVTLIDEKIGEIMQSLKEAGYLDNAVVIFTSDHGDCLGDYANVEKWCMYDVVTNVPLIIWSSNGRYLKGQKKEQLVQWFDIAPVIMELAGIAIPDYWEAISLTPLLTGESEDEIRDYVYSEQCADANRSEDLQCITMIRDKRWKLVFYLGDDENGELYDLMSAEGEYKNLWHDSAYEGIKQKLIVQLLKWKISSQYRTVTR